VTAPLTRRTLLVGLGRLGAATALGAVVVRLGGRDGRGTAPPCARCQALSGCTWPEGEQVRRARAAAGPLAIGPPIGTTPIGTLSIGTPAPGLGLCERRPAAGRGPT
jgi:hypothetical protein